jgi:uncharacterized protein (DUF58 family)
MLSRELIKKIRRIEIRTRRVVQDQLAGRYHSVFKGRGIAFEGVREYHPGDDVRAIDWNVTARTNQAFVKVFAEERELTVILLVDMSRSRIFGTRGQTKAELMAELAALLAFSAIANNDRVGLVAFTDEIERFVPPRKGRKHVLRVVSEVLNFQPARPGTDLSAGLHFLNRALRHGAVAFLVSDFEAPLGSYEAPLKVAARKHDLIALEVHDPWEETLPALGLVHAADAETGEVRWIDWGSAEVQRWYRETRAREVEARTRLWRRLNVDAAALTAGTEYERTLMDLFARRARRIAAA